jgi:hypothetical protein
MAFADHFNTADPLESLSWVAMPDSTRTEKLAYLYRKGERNIRYAHRNYDGPTTGTVKVFVRTLYEPPRGKIGATTKEVLAAVIRQKAKAEKRSKNPPYKRPKLCPKKRRDALARHKYATIEKDYSGESKRMGYNCIALSVISNILIMVDRGGYSAPPRVYMEDKRSRTAKVAVLDARTDDVKSLSDALTLMSPNRAVRAMFGGASIALDFRREGFNVDGELVPWANILKVYRGDEVFRMKSKPKKDK